MEQTVLKNRVSERQDFIFYGGMTSWQHSRYVYFLVTMSIQNM